ncbi:DUF2637 domain-containing protein [Streptomyces sp. NPDC047097]|uniref:DUF2637 domain-containing protein n=1 Tax=Streptomyces sp. NPDC047097 TaxID=3155260 RepID=UPI0033CC0A18
MAAMQLTRTHRVLIGLVIAGAVIIAGIGFAGSYAAVRELAERKGFGDFSLVFPIGIDAGICVLLALDLLLTWLRIPFPLLRQTAWLLTIATIAFNGAASWPDPLGVGMHAVIPVLFVVAVEAARHAVGRIADITADKHMEGVRLTRWLLSPVPTFRLWRRMKLWELRSYEQVIKLEQDRLIYQARLQARYGRAWRRKAPVESLMPLRLARYGVPLAETGPAGLAAAGIEPALLPPSPQETAAEPLPLTTGAPALPEAADQVEHRGGERDQEQPQQHPAVDPEQGPPRPAPTKAAEAEAVRPEAAPQEQHGQQPDEQQPYGPQPQDGPEQPYGPQPQHAPQQPYGPHGPQTPQDADAAEAIDYSSPWFSAPREPQPAYQGAYDPEYGEAVAEEAVPEVVLDTEAFGRAAYEAYKEFKEQYDDAQPNAQVFGDYLASRLSIRHPQGTTLLNRLLPGFEKRYQQDLAADQPA